MSNEQYSYIGLVNLLTRVAWLIMPVSKSLVNKSQVNQLTNPTPAKTSNPDPKCNNGMGFDIKVVNSTFDKL